MLDNIKLTRDERDEALEEITLAAKSCLEEDGTIHEFNASVEKARVAGYLDKAGPVRVAQILKGRSPAVQGLVSEQFPESYEIALIITATEEHEGLLVAKEALQHFGKPEFIHFVKGFPEDFLTVYVALRDECEKTMSLLMDKVRILGFEFAYDQDRETWDCYRFRNDCQHFELVISVKTHAYVHAGIMALVEARIYEIGRALRELIQAEA